MANYTPPDAGSDDGKPSADKGTKKKEKNEPRPNTRNRYSYIIHLEDGWDVIKYSVSFTTELGGGR